MATPNGSFIPQRPTKGTVAARSFRKVYVLSYISYLLFFTTILAVLALLAYQWTVESRLSDLQRELLTQKDLFSEVDLQRVQDLDIRLEATEDLVNSHVSVVRILEALEATTVTPVQLTDFSYDRSTYEQPQLVFNARASSFDRVIFQERIYQGNEQLGQIDIANISLTREALGEDESGPVEQIVTINFTTPLDLNLVNYLGEGVVVPVQTGSAEEPEASEPEPEAVTNDQI